MKIRNKLFVFLALLITGIVTTAFIDDYGDNLEPRTAAPVKSAIQVNGEDIMVEIYIIEDEYYVNVRDVYNLAGDTETYYYRNLVWNGDTGVITLISDSVYAPTGNENKRLSTEAKKAYPAYIYNEDGRKIIAAYIIDGHTYLSLKDINEYITYRFALVYYEPADTILINTRPVYSGAVNQEIVKGPGWRQIVQDSQFQIGGVLEEREEYSFGTYPNIDGSTVAIPMAMEFMWQHLGNDFSQNFVSFSTTRMAYEWLIYPTHGQTKIYRNRRMDTSRKVDIIFATKPSHREVALAKYKNVELMMEPVCYDAFVFITHKDNPVESLTLEQIQKIYSGKITNWNEVGGEDRTIIPYQREDSSGSQTAMEQLVMKDILMLPAPKTKVVYGMGGLIDAVAEPEGINSIGYTYKYYIDNLYISEDIKMIAVEGVYPDNDNIRSEEYMFTTNYYGVIRKRDMDDIGGLFLQWMLSEEGQQCIEQAGYIPMD